MNTMNTPFRLAALMLVLIASNVSLPASAQTNSTAGTTNRPPATRFPRPEVRYEYGPDSERHEGVPAGKVIDFVWKDSKVFPGTIRQCAVYIPAQYDSNHPAALMVFQDGVRHYLRDTNEFRAAIVFDNLIHKKEIPVLIGVFIDPGYKRTELPPGREPRSTAENRSFEYDTLSEDYGNFVLTEILPYVQKQYGLRLTDNPEGRAICGMSSGAICAWTVAWDRPDQFRKVVSHVGSFTNIRGGHKYPEMIRNADWKPIRIFLQDGASDNRGRNPERNWIIANHNMAAALEEKDYDYKYVYGEGPHSGNHGGSIFPDTLRWLWRDYPK